MAMAPVEMMSPAGKGYYAAKPLPPPHHKAPYVSSSYNNATTTRARRSSSTHDEEASSSAVEGTVLVLRAGAAAAAFVAVALIASCRHGDWMEFTRYQEYMYLLGASVVACVYSAAQALRNFRRMRRGYTSSSPVFLDFAGDQVVAYVLITASSAALPITIRMRSAVVNIFTDAMTAAITLAFIAFAALAFSAMLSGFRIAAQAHY